MLRQLILTGAVALASVSAAAQTKLDISVPWGPTEFHTINAQNFAKRVRSEERRVGKECA